MSSNAARKFEEELTEDSEEDSQDVGFLDLEDEDIEMIEPLKLVKSDEEEDLDDLHLMHLPAVASIRSRVAERPVCEEDPARSLLKSQIPVEAFEVEPEAAKAVLEARWMLYQWACQEPEERDSDVILSARKELFSKVPQHEGLLVQWRRAIVMITESA
ncbi:MAG TPA: hypothetical protein QGF58_25945 [Myxococcota bacterium]|nr:hypothetical protein [Myxococcota bacterium]